MNTNLIVTVDELLRSYRDGEKRGFLAGVIFSVGGYALIRKMKQEDRLRVTIKTNQNEPDSD